MKHDLDDADLECVTAGKSVLLLLLPVLGEGMRQWLQSKG